MRLSLGVLTLILGFAGCSMSTGILPAGPNTYTITERDAPILGGSMAAEQNSMVEANAFCARQGRQFLPTDNAELAGIMNPRPTGYTVTFQCLLPGDPQLARGGSTRAPDAIVDQRSR
jgi:hypothetical protein